MSAQEFSNPIVIAIITLALFVFYRLILALLNNQHVNNENLKLWQKSLNMCICALPLLGLLGTIIGLLDAFTAMSHGEGLGENSSLLTTGISDALFTTQLGLLMAIPSWLLLSITDRKLNRDTSYAN